MTILQGPIESGWVVASGEGNFYDQNIQGSGGQDIDLHATSGQVPRFYSGINRHYPSPETHESGVLHTYPENSGSYEQILGNSGEVQGIKDSFLSPPRDISYSEEPYYANLGVFFPYIHHYPRWVPPATSLFSTIEVPVPFKVDYSLTFSPTNSYNRYSERDVDYDAVDSSGDPIFTDEAGKPPTRFG